MIITFNYWLLFLGALVLMLISLGLDSERLSKKAVIKPLRHVFAALFVITLLVLCWMNFSASLTLIVIVSALILCVDKLFFARRRESLHRPKPFIVDNAYALFWVFLLVWVIRSFIVQPYRVPTGSLQPTVRPGDFLVVNQFSYGIHFPAINEKLLAVGEPKPGDVALFYLPTDPSMLLVKRVIGVPGDHIVYKDKILTINGHEMTQIDLGSVMDDEPATALNIEEHIPVREKRENLAGVTHNIYVTPDKSGPLGNFDITVPPHQYFMMGDNRDNSDDSRSWGFVPEANLVGKAFGIFMSWDALQDRVRWERMGMRVE